MSELFIAGRTLSEGAVGYVEKILADRPVDERYEFSGDESTAMKMTEAQCQRFRGDTESVGGGGFFQKPA